MTQTQTGTLDRPASITDELLDSITSQVVSTGGGVWKLTEVYTGEVITTLRSRRPRTSRPPLRVHVRPSGSGPSGR